MKLPMTKFKELCEEEYREFKKSYQGDVPSVEFSRHIKRRMVDWTQMDKDSFRISVERMGSTEMRVTIQYKLGAMKWGNSKYAYIEDPAGLFINAVPKAWFNNAKVCV